MICTECTLNSGYVPNVSNHIEHEEFLVFCPIWDFSRSCGMQARNNGGPCQDYGNNQFGSPGECQTVGNNAGPYWILSKVHQSLCLDYQAHGKFAEEGWYILLG